jgi:hypothetical protein
MSRTLVDDDLNSWEAFASTGPYGYAERSVVVFHCTTDPGERPRAFALGGDKSDAEAAVATAERGRLLEMLAGAEPLA